MSQQNHTVWPYFLAWVCITLAFCGSSLLYVVLIWWAFDWVPTWTQLHWAFVAISAITAEFVYELARAPHRKS